jgi:hypothetical protein
MDADKTFVLNLCSSAFIGGYLLFHIFSQLPRERLLWNERLAQFLATCLRETPDENGAAQEES